MRKWNALISVLILALFIVHAVSGTYQMAGILPGGSSFRKVLAFVMLVLLILHALIGTILGIETVKAMKKSGVFYLRENQAFFAQRISGFAMLLFILVHLLIFYVKDSPKFVLHDFGVQQLTVSILLVACLVVHLVFGIRQLLISLGIRSFSEILADVLFVVSVVLLLSAIAFLIYFYRWNLAWRP